MNENENKGRSIPKTHKNVATGSVRLASEFIKKDVNSTESEKIASPKIISGTAQDLKPKKK